MSELGGECRAALTVCGIHVAKSLRSRGYGQALVLRTLRLAQEHQIDRAFIVFPACLLHAIDWWKRLDFTFGCSTERAIKDKVMQQVLGGLTCVPFDACIC